MRLSKFHLSLFGNSFYSFYTLHEEVYLGLDGDGES